VEEIIDKILEILKGKHFPEIKSYLFGDPVTYASWDLPCIAVAPARTTSEAYTMGRTGRDKGVHGVTIYVVRSARDGFSKDSSDSGVDRFLIQTADATVATLREDVTLGGVVATHKTSAVQYVTAVRGREAVRMAQIDVTFEKFKSRQGG